MGKKRYIKKKQQSKPENINIIRLKMDILKCLQNENVVQLFRYFY